MNILVLSVPSYIIAALQYNKFIANNVAVEQSAAFLAEDVFANFQTSPELTSGAITGIVLAVLIAVFLLILTVTIICGYAIHTRR